MKLPRKIYINNYWHWFNGNTEFSALKLSGSCNMKTYLPPIHSISATY